MQTNKTVTWKHVTCSTHPQTSVTSCLWLNKPHQNWLKFKRQFPVLNTIITLQQISMFLSRNTSKMQLCNRIYYSKVHWRLNMFQVVCRSKHVEPSMSFGIINSITEFMSDVLLETCWAFNELWNNKFYYRAWWAVCRSKHVEPSMNFGIINSITELDERCAARNMLSLQWTLE